MGKRLWPTKEAIAEARAAKKVAAFNPATGLTDMQEAAATRIEPPPVKNDLPAAWDLVIADMKARDDFGKAKYGTRLQPHNGRDQLADAYQEALDLAVYLRNALYERDGR